MDRVNSRLWPVLRGMLRRPWFCAAVIATTAIGIGPNVATYSVLRSVVLADSPFRDVDRLVWIGHRPQRGQVDEELGMTPGLYSVYTLDPARTPGLESMAMFIGSGTRLTGFGQPLDLGLFETTPNLPEVLGIEPQLGRWFDAEDVVRGRAVVGLGDGLWRGHFGADTAVVGRSVTLNRTPTEIVGVMPPEFVGPWGAQLWQPFVIEGTAPFRVDQPYGAFRFGAVGRLAADGDPATVARELASRLPAVDEWHPGDFARFVLEGARVQPTVASLEATMDDGSALVAILLTVTTAFVLLIAMANVGGLLIIRTRNRRCELAIRAALGAGWARQTVTVMMESAVLCALGGALGAWLAVAFADSLAILVPPSAGGPPPRIDGGLVALAVFVGVLAGALCTAGTLWPLRESTFPGRPEHSPIRSGARFRTAFIAAQVAIALVLLVGAGLTLRTLRNMQSVELAFQAHGALTFETYLIEMTRTEAAAFQSELVDRLEALPGVRSAGAARCLPLVPYCHVRNVVTSQAGSDVPGSSSSALVNVATPGYFRTLGTPIIAGRTFERDEERAVALVSRSLARTLWGDRSALGQRLLLGEGEEADWISVSGVVGDLRPHTLRDVPPETHAIYVPLRANVGRSPRQMKFVVRAEGDPTAVAEAVRQTAWSMDAELAISAVEPLDVRLDIATGTERGLARLLLSFSLLAVGLSFVGMFSSVSYLVAGRTVELGVRKALGARSSQLFARVIGHGLSATAMGLAVGTAAALLLTRFLESMLFGVTRIDGLTYASGAFVLLLASCAACAVPGLRAARVDATSSLRAE